MHSKVTDSHLNRIAYIYVRQSTMSQVEQNLESQRRQYGLADRAKGMGFNDVQVIDDDLGLSGSESKKRRGFQRLVADVGLGKVGAVFGLEVSRFARNNSDWYHLLDLCALFDTLIADHESVYHPGRPDDRLVLGLKGTMSEVELNVLRARMFEGARQKALRGELVTVLPIGYIRGLDDRIEKDPDIRVQKAIELVFSRFRELTTARQVFLQMLQEGIEIPVVIYSKFGHQVEWRKARYRPIFRILKNPTYAGAYVRGRLGTRTKVVDGHIVKSRGHEVPREDWEIVIKDHHEAYVSWSEFERNQKTMTGNCKALGDPEKGAIGQGSALLSGLLRCKRCGLKLHVSYQGRDGCTPLYSCYNRVSLAGEKACIRLGGMRLDAAVAREVLEVVRPAAIDAATKAFKDYRSRQTEQRQRFVLDLRSAEYEAERAYRQFNGVDPENRLVVAQLEAKWNESLRHVDEAKQKLGQLGNQTPSIPEEQRLSIMALTHDLPLLWEQPTTTNEMKKRIIRTVIEEIVADVDETRMMMVVMIHWVGGLHTKIEVKKNRVGEHRFTTDKSIVELVTNLAAQIADKFIASTLNKLKLRTGAGHSWKSSSIRTLRQYNHIPVYNPARPREHLTLEEACECIGLSNTCVRRLISNGVLKATQIVPHAPWVIQRSELSRPEIKAAVRDIQASRTGKRSPWLDGQKELFLSDQRGSEEV